MKISKTIKENKITSLSLTFESDDEIACLEDMVALSEREVIRYSEYRTGLPEMLAFIKKELK